MLPRERVQELHRELLAAQAANDLERALSINRELRAGPGAGRLARRARLAAQTLSPTASSRTLASLARQSRDSGACRRPVYTCLTKLREHFQSDMLEPDQLAQLLVVVSAHYRSAVHGVPDPARTWRGNRPTPGPGPALELPSELRAFLADKEQRGQLMWVSDSPGETLRDLSARLASMTHPATGTRYSALNLTATWWRRRFPNEQNIPRFTRSGAKVATNMLSNSTEPRSLAELLHQSNPRAFLVVASCPRLAAGAQLARQPSLG